MVVWSCGRVVMWSCGRVVMWSCGHVVVWSCGRVVMWLCGHVVVWSCGHVVVWSMWLCGPCGLCGPSCTTSKYQCNWTSGPPRNTLLISIPAVVWNYSDIE